MEQHRSTSNKPQNGLVASILCVVVVTGTVIGYPTTFDLSLSMRAGHHLLHVEMKSGDGLALASASASGRVHGG